MGHGAGLWLAAGMQMPTPAAPPFDVPEWEKSPFPDRVRMACQAWAMQGYGTPLPVYGLYVFKVLLYVWGWCWFCSFTEGMGGFTSMASWAFTPVAFKKAVVWSMLFEGLGLGCSSGPLSGRYNPPVAAFLHFLRPGTTKMPLFPGIAVFGEMRRGWLDVLLYAAHCAFLVRALVAPTLMLEHLLPTVILLPLLGLTDKTIFLAARAEHYFSALVCFLFADDWMAGSKVVWFCVWFWAATSKLNHHFPTVICVMTSNNPVLRARWLRRSMYAHYPDDLRPSALAKMLAHVGTVVEYAFPLVLAFGNTGPWGNLALLVMLGFHAYIVSNVPLAVPIEWNFMMVYGALYLFGWGGAVPMLDIHSPVLAAFLVGNLVLVPLLGNLFPARFSFLSAMRYYAGNWAYGVWLFKGDSSKKLDRMVKATPRPRDQLEQFYDPTTVTGLLSTLLGFRFMHLHGRALHTLLPQAVDDMDQYEWFDGELVAGMVLGWNFGDGHLHNMTLLQEVQAQCGFEPGELRCVMVESQPLGRSTMAYTVADAAAGVLSTGHVNVKELLSRQPWPVAAAPVSAADASQSSAATA